MLLLPCWLSSDEDGADDFAEGEHGTGEYDFRHPGTHWESDDEDERGDNDIFSPIATKAGQELGSILRAGVCRCPCIPACLLRSVWPRVSLHPRLV